MTNFQGGNKPVLYIIIIIYIIYIYSIYIHNIIIIHTIYILHSVHCVFGSAVLDSWFMSVDTLQNISAELVFM